MSEGNETERPTRIDRRKVLLGLGVGVSAGVAGCGSQQQGEEQSPSPTQATGTATSTPPSDQLVRGGKPIMGMSSAPENLNPLGRASAYTLQILENIYTGGTLLHPKTRAQTPWAFKDWALKPENVGTGKPTLVGELRDDLTFNDGTKVTAEDVKFTIEYVREQEPGGNVTASQFSAIEEINVDSPKGTTVNYFFKEKDSAWFQSILGTIILPKHIWKDISNFEKYEPRKSKEGLVGPGPMVLKDFKWESWFELRMRPREEIPFPSADYADWLHDDAPFIDGLRVEIFGSKNALQEAVLNGNVTVAYGSFEVDQAARATKKNFLTVKRSPDDGWQHHSFNTRRVPLNDPAFRNLLVMMVDSKWLVEELFKGIGATEGTYATLPSRKEWRPPEPTEINEYEGIPVPDLVFPGQRGSFQLGEKGVTKAREFLMTHSRAKHDYTFGEAVTNITTAPDGKELYVNDKPLPEAHTDNDGNPGLGPLEMSYNPPQDAPASARLSQRWIGALKRLGIPVKGLVQSFNSQRPKMYIKEDFDIYEMSWTRTETYDQYRVLYSGNAADVESNSDSYLFNSMGYTGADDLIAKQATLMDPEKRKPVVKKVLARIWADAPTDITFHERILQPVNTEFAGWIETIGGAANPQSWLNLRKTSK